MWEFRPKTQAGAHLERSFVLFETGVLASNNCQLGWGGEWLVDVWGFLFSSFYLFLAAWNLHCCAGFPQLWWAGTTLQCVGFFCCSVQAVGCMAFSSRGAWAQLLQGMCDIPGAGGWTCVSASAGRFLTTGPPGMSQVCVLKRWFWPLISWFWGGQLRACEKQQHKAKIWTKARSNRGKDTGEILGRSLKESYEIQPKVSMCNLEEIINWAGVFWFLKDYGTWHCPRRQN